MLLPGPRVWLALLLAMRALSAQARDLTIESGVKSAVYLSPKLTLEPGSVSYTFFYDMEMPRGHVAIKSFILELVDDEGKSIPLHETYLHHGTVVRYYIRQGAQVPKSHDDFDLLPPSDSDSVLIAGISGLCKFGLSQTFGLGAETRKTARYIPNPYGIEIGNLDEIPQGYEELWQLNVHAIDTRGVEDKLGCIECRCNLYNVTTDEYGQLLNPNYVGGRHCCYKGTQCRVKQGFPSVERSLYLKYSVEWMDWDNSIIPVNVYIFDVTDTWKKSDGSTAPHDCKIEYDVDSCSGGTECVDTKRFILSAPVSGDIIYGVGHQHIGGIGTALYGEDGRVLCSSIPIYGQGNEAGDEAGYVVGMSTCYPQPGSVKMSKGETIIVESNYSSAQSHTGVMGFFYILVAQTPPASSKFESLSASSTTQVMFGVVIAAAIIAFTYQRKSSKSEDEYESLVM